MTNQECVLIGILKLTKIHTVKLDVVQIGSFEGSLD